MKKFKKLLAGLLAGAMMLGSMTTTAFAEENTATTPVSTIDTTKKGSLTVYKYFFTNSMPNPTPTPGTGEAGESIPAGAELLNGAEFSIWKIADIDGKIDENRVFEATGNMTTDASTAEGIIGTNLPFRKAVTGDSNGDGIVNDSDDENFKGKAVFGALDLGYYYVKETKTPANISSTAVAFVVSIPMTNQKETNEKGTKWIYDVVVYPKNVKTEAGVTIKKVDAKGDPAAANAKFVLQKMDSTGAWKYVSLSDDGVYNYENSSYENATQFAQNASITGLGNGAYRLWEISAENGYIMDGTVAYRFTIADNGDITGTENNNYLTYVKIKGENGNEEDNLKSAIITVENVKPDMTKEVQKRDDSWGHDADYNVGDMVPYRITIDVPSNITSLKYFTLTDTPTNLRDSIETDISTSKSFTVECENNSISTDAYKVEQKKMKMALR